MWSLMQHQWQVLSLLGRPLASLQEAQSTHRAGLCAYNVRGSSTSSRSISAGQAAARSTEGQHCWGFRHPPHAMPMPSTPSEAARSTPRALEVPEIRNAECPPQPGADALVPSTSHGHSPTTSAALAPAPVLRRLAGAWDTSSEETCSQDSTFRKTYRSQLPGMYSSDDSLGAFDKPAKLRSVGQKLEAAAPASSLLERAGDLPDAPGGRTSFPFGGMMAYHDRVLHRDILRIFASTRLWWQMPAAP